MAIVVWGLNHKTAPVEIREKLALSRHQLQQQAKTLHDLQGIEGMVVLSTCNRLEVYFTAENPEYGRDILLSHLAAIGGLSPDVLAGYIYWKENREAVWHLFRVASGLDSMVLGESQILGQLEAAYNDAREFHLSNHILNGLMQKAISVGKRVRTETYIDRQALSVGSAAVEMARDLFGDLEGRNVLVLGAGETSRLTLKHLHANGASTVIVANRTYAKAVEIAGEYGGQAVRLERFPDFLISADIVISCTASPGYLIRTADLAMLIPDRGGRPLLMLDIAVPRDIEPSAGDLDLITLYDVDDLQGVVQKNLGQRKNEAVKAELIIHDELAEFFRWLDTLLVVPVITALKNKADTIREEELDKALRKLGAMTEREKNIIRSLAGSVINKLLNDPIANLKEYAHTEKGENYADALRVLFNLEEQAGSEREEVLTKP